MRALSRSRAAWRGLHLGRTLPRAMDEVGLLDSDEIAAELGLGDGDSLGGFGSAFDEDLASLEEIGAGGADTGFADELAELDVPEDGDRS